MKNPNEEFRRITVDQNLFDTIRRKNAFICDMDGVLYHGNRLIPGAKDFIEWLKREKKKFLFLTNSSERSPQELADKLQRLGIDVDKEHFYRAARIPVYKLRRQSFICRRFFARYAYRRRKNRISIKKRHGYHRRKKA